jgi:pimeloyl-ACP methyl ester carboxylesterase
MQLRAAIVASLVILAMVAAPRLALTEALRATADDGNLGLGFHSEFAEANGVRLHYVEGGSGPAVVLLPGWPQTWYAFRKIMPELAKAHHVIAVDLRGMGESERPDGGYDTRTLAEDIHALMGGRGITRYSVIGHDIGMWVAYPLAATHGDEIDRLVVSEALIPGVSETPPMLMPPDQNAGLTQFMFNQLRDLPEFLVAGREAAYLRWVVQHLAFRPDRVAVDEYIRTYSVPGAMRAGFAYYRAIPETARQNAELRKSKLTMPVLAIGGGALGAGKVTIDTMKVVSDQVQGALIDKCGHYTPEECPDAFLKLVKPFLAP